MFLISQSSLIWSIGLFQREEKRKNELLEKYNDGGHTLGPSSSKSFKPGKQQF